MAAKDLAIASICNLALGHIAMKEIDLISDTTPEAQACNSVYVFALKETLRSYNWGFATAIIPLVNPPDADDWVTATAYIVGDHVIHSTYIYYCLIAHTSGTFATDLAASKWVLQQEYTALDWEYAYAYPLSLLAVWRVYAEGETDKNAGQPFRQLYDHLNSKKVIATNVEDAYAEGTYYVDDPDLFDANFVTAFSYRLAAELAIRLTGNVDMNKQMIVIFNNAISEAGRMSSYENKPDDDSPNPIVDVRG
jgi:hypothetical protein